MTADFTYEEVKKMANDQKTFALYVHTGLEEDRKYIIQFILLNYLH